MSEDKQTQLVAGKRTNNWAALASLMAGLALVVLSWVLRGVNPKVFFVPAYSGIAFSIVVGVWIGYHNHQGKMLSLAGMVLSVSAMILYPQFRLAYDLGGLVECSQQLNKIGEGIEVYQKYNGGLNPASLETLVEKGIICADLLICSRCKGPAAGQTYIYRGGDLNDKANGGMILVYEKSGYHRGGEFNVLFADGRARRYGGKEIWELIDRDNALRREMGIAEKPMEVVPWLGREGDEIVQEQGQ